MPEAAKAAGEGSLEIGLLTLLVFIVFIFFVNKIAYRFHLKSKKKLNKLKKDLASGKHAEGDDN